MSVGEADYVDSLVDLDRLKGQDKRDIEMTSSQPQQTDASLVSPPLTVAEDSQTSPPLTGMRPRRRNGFQRPFSRDQEWSWITHIILFAGFYGLWVYWYIDSHGKASDPNSTSAVGHFRNYVLATLIIHSVLALVGYVSWYFCEELDPSEEGNSRWLVAERWTKKRYCAECRKNVPGLDHHCTWLHTCIGTRNFVYFFVLTTCGTFIFAFSTVLPIVFFATPGVPSLLDGAWSIIFQVLISIFGLGSLVIASSYGSLWIFHIYLLIEGYSTYDWLLQRREAARLNRTGIQAPTPGPTRIATPSAV